MGEGGGGRGNERCCDVKGVKRRKTIGQELVNIDTYNLPSYILLIGKKMKA